MKRICSIVIISHLLFNLVCHGSETDNTKAVIPMDLSSHRPVIELTINGQGPYRFIFDTGSTNSVIDTAIAKQLNLKVIGSDPLKTPGSSNELLSDRLLVTNVNFAGTDIFKDLEMNAMQLRNMLPIDGILSGITFEEYLVSMDYPNSQLTLSYAELDKANSDVTPFLQKARVLNLNIEVDGHTLEAHFDTGNPGGFALPLSMQDKLKFKHSPKEDGVIRTPVATFRKWQAQLIGEINVGNIVFVNPPVYLIENFQFANFGYNVLKDLRTTIDRKNNLLKFESSKKINKSEQASSNIANTDVNEFTGWYGDTVRHIFMENKQMYLQRVGGPQLKLNQLESDIYEMVHATPVDNELPKVRFERNEDKTIEGFTFLFANGRTDFVRKDQ